MGYACSSLPRQSWEVVKGGIADRGAPREILSSNGRRIFVFYGGVLLCYSTLSRSPEPVKVLNGLLQRVPGHGDAQMLLQEISGR